MSSKSIYTATDRTPYTYLIGWSEFKIYYYGVRFAKGCRPNEFWKSYFTSSKRVATYIKQHGDPDIIEIRRVFDDANKARLWETCVLKRMKVIERLDFLNLTDNISIAPMPGESNPMFGVKRPDGLMSKVGKAGAMSQKILRQTDEQWAEAEKQRHRDDWTETRKREHVDRFTGRSSAINSYTKEALGMVLCSDPRWITGEICSPSKGIKKGTTRARGKPKAKLVTRIHDRKLMDIANFMKWIKNE